MTSSTFSAEHDLENLGLRIIFLVVECKKHNYQNRIWTTVPTFIDTLPNVDLKVVKDQDISKYLSNLFIRYSTIVILINCYNFPCRAKNLRLIIKALECNESLRFKLKIICTLYKYHPESYKDFEWNLEFSLDTMFLDYCNYMLSKLENTFLFQDCHIRSSDLMLKKFVEILKDRPLISAHELVKVLTTSCVILTLSKGNVELYFYSVNPALAIIINNYYFTNHKEYDDRKGSEKDVLKLIQQFRISQTPYMVLHDFKNSELLKLVHFFQHEDLSRLKCIYFITMTHGTKNNIVYTNDGKLNFIEDILQPIQSNQSLKNTHITFLNIHCRGNINGYTMDYDASDNIVPTKIPQLQANICVFYSVPDLLTSPRCPKKGSPFVDSFSTVYGLSTCPSNIENLSEKIIKELENHVYYATLNCFDKYPELVLADGTTAHYIKPMPTNDPQTVSVYKSINEKCHHLFGNNNIKTLRNTNDEKRQLAPAFCLYTNKNEPEFPDKSTAFTEARKLNKENRHNIMKCCKTETRIFYSIVRAKKTSKISNLVDKINLPNREILDMNETYTLKIIRDFKADDKDLNFPENLQRKYQNVFKGGHKLELDRFIQHVEFLYIHFRYITRSSSGSIYFYENFS